MSSIHRRKIIAIDASGNTSDFVPSGRDGLWGVYALALDVARDRLWCTTAAGPEIEGFDPADSGRTALCSFSLRTGVQLTRIELPRDHEPHVLGDMTLGPDGRVYLTDSRAGGVYRFRPGAATLDTLAPSGTFASPQAPLVAPDSRRLLVPDYPRGIAALDLATGHVSWLAKPRSLASGGIDGLSRSGARLIAIQNGITPHRVVELALDAGATRIESWRVLEQGSEWLGEPNHGVFAGRDFVFIGNSGWDRVGDDGTFRTLPADRPPVLLRLARALR